MRWTRCAFTDPHQARKLSPARALSVIQDTTGYRSIRRRRRPAVAAPAAACGNLPRRSSTRRAAGGGCPNQPGSSVIVAAEHEARRIEPWRITMQYLLMLYVNEAAW